MARILIAVFGSWLFAIPAHAELRAGARAVCITPDQPTPLAGYYNTRHPGKLSTNIARVAGPIDPDVAVVLFESSRRAPIASYVNFAMHPDTVGGLEYSADYAFTLTRHSTPLCGMAGCAPDGKS